MYIDFMDTLRNIQSGIYPQIKNWYVDIKDMLDAVQKVRDDVLIIKDEVKGLKCDTNAFKMDAASWANEGVDIPVKEFMCRTECGTIVEVDRQPKVFSAKHYAAKAQCLSQVERCKAEAAKKTAWSFANEDHGVYVQIFTARENCKSDGSCTVNSCEFDIQVLDCVYSAKHYAMETENLSGQMRWVETQEALQCQKRFVFSKDINHADVYVNGIRQIAVDCYTTAGNVLMFTSELNIGDTVTVSGMEAITSDYSMQQIDEIKKLSAEAKLAKCQAVAAQKTAQSFTAEPSGQTVKIYTADKNCGIQITDTTFYSTLHWSEQITLLKSGIMVLDLYADLEHLNPSDATTVYLRGGLTINDGRHGMFIYDHTHTCTNNGGTVINGYVREYYGPANVRWFLAEGDGMHDDTKGIKKAIEIKEDLFFPKGTYLTTEKIVFDDIKVDADEVTLMFNMEEGRAVTCQKMRYGQGIYGSMLVDWYGYAKKKEKIGYFMQDCDGAQFDIGSKDSSAGVMLDPDFGHAKDNTFNLNVMKNNTVGVYVGSSFKRYLSEGNKFFHGEFSFNETLKPSQAFKDKASFVYVDGGETSGIEFIRPDFDLADRDDSDFLLFRLNGDNVYMKPDSVKIGKNGGVFGEVTGDDAILDFSLTPELTVYRDPRFDKLGYKSTVEAKGAKNLTVLGTSNLEDHDIKSYELITNGEKPAYTIANAIGIAAYFPIDGDRPAIEVEDYITGAKLLISPWKLSFSDPASGDKTFVGNGLFEITDGIITTAMTKKGVKITVDPQHPFDWDIGFRVKKGDISSEINTHGFGTFDDASNKFALMLHDKTSLDSGKGDVLVERAESIRLFHKHDNSSVEILRDKFTITDGTRVTTIEPEGILIKGKKVDNIINLSADGTPEIERAEDKENVLTLSNKGRGGGLLINVPQRGDAALRIHAHGKSVTEIRSGDTWIADGKKIQWHGLAAPTTGIWEVGDMVFGDEPIVNGMIGWVCVQQGRPGKWKAWGEVDIFNTTGHKWRNQEENYYASPGQDEFKVHALVKDARVLVNGIKIPKNEFEIHAGHIETVIKLLTPASKDDWVSIEF